MECYINGRLRLWKVRRRLATGALTNLRRHVMSPIHAYLHISTSKLTPSTLIFTPFKRDGVDMTTPAGLIAACDLVKDINSSEFTKLKMLYTHGGHSYDVTYGDVAAIKACSIQEREAVSNLMDKLLEEKVIENREDVITGVGSTPTCSHLPDDEKRLSNIDEMHPGNYSLYDVNQHMIGSCGLEDIAGSVLTRVVGHYPKSNKLQIDCGWTGCSAQGKEYDYGKIVNVDGTSDGLYICNLKQEAGDVTSNDPIDFEKYTIGSLLRILPWHSCAAVHQHRVIHVVRGVDVIDEWEVCDGW